MKKCMLAVMVFGFVLSACQTGAQYEKVSSSDCLVLVPSTLINQEGGPVLRKYYLELNDGQVIKVPENKRSFIPIIISQEDVYVISIVSKLDDYVVGEATKRPMNLQLPYVSGKAVVSDATFVQEIIKKDAYSYVTRAGFINTTSDQKAETMELFRKKKYSESWQF